MGFFFSFLFLQLVFPLIGIVKAGGVDQGVKGGKEKKKKRRKVCR